MLACDNKHIDTVELLIAEGANVEAKDHVRAGPFEAGRTYSN
jgi:ankyrin repeat protein